jgi:hypothetical protein
MLSRLVTAAQHVRIRTVVRVAVAITGLLGVLGAVQVAVGGATGAPKSLFLHQIDLDAELNVPSFWAAGLLGLASLAALARAWSRSHLRAAWTGLAMILAFMSADEVVQFHERLQRAVSADWQLAYVPVALAAGVAWAAIVRRSRNPTVRAGLIVGAALWVAAQFLEWLWRSGYWFSAWESVPEELFEALGNVAFLAATLASLNRPAVRGQRPRTLTPQETVTERPLAVDVGAGETDPEPRATASTTAAV